MIWVGGAQGAGKTTWSWQLSRAHDLPLHPVDLWAYDHQARLPAGDSLDDQLARGPEAAADAFESVSRLRLELVLDDIRARDLGPVPAIVEGPQLMPGFAGELPPGWGVWLGARSGAHAPCAGGTAGKGAGARRPHGGCRRRALHRLLERDAVIAGRVRASAALSGRPVIEVPPRARLARDHGGRRVGARPGPALLRLGLAPGRELSRQRRHENRAADRQGRLWMRRRRTHRRRPPTRSGANAGRAGAALPGRPRPTTTRPGPLDERPLIAHRRRPPWRAEDRPVAR